MRSNAVQIAEEEERLLNLRELILNGRFSILQRIARGSYAEIYLARNLAPRPDEPETVIVKALNFSLQGDPDPDLERTLIENIELEAQTMKRFSHDHIVRLFACGAALDQDGREFYYLVLEYMSGGSLAQFCRARPLTFEQALDYTAQICSALSYAHANDVLHRDVKPNNIMLSADRRKVKLLDFGTARLLSSDNGLITKVGTDTYAAPEHYSLSNRPRVKLTPAVDVYALAKNVYFMLSGATPFAFKQQPITSLPAPIDVQLWAGRVLRVLSKATCERPLDRYQSVQDFYDDLSAMSEETVHSSHRWGNPASAPEHNVSRIVVEVKSMQPRDHGAIAETIVLLLIEYGAGLTSSIARWSRMACSWAHPYLRWGLALLTGSYQKIWQHLKTIPFGLLARIAAVVTFCLILLLTTPYLLKLWRSQSTLNSHEQAKTIGANEILVTANTDINIRFSPNSKAQKIGLAERGSQVRVLSFSSDQKWCEIEVLQHGREKANPSSVDRGWVNRSYLKFG
jgi:serine/threonine protein kinase